MLGVGIPPVSFGPAAFFPNIPNGTTPPDSIEYTDEQNHVIMRWEKRLDPDGNIYYVDQHGNSWGFNSMQ